MNTDTAALASGFARALRAALPDPATPYPGHAIGTKVLSAPLTPLPPPQPAQPAVLALLPAALDNARAVSAPMAVLADRIAALAPSVTWRQRQDPDDPGFADVHANGIVLGGPGLAQPGAYMVGLSLIAPGRAYPLHDHPPEELYLVLSPGQFRHGPPDAVGDWVDVPAGGTFTNTPGLIHAMRAGPDAPLLAVWLLGDTA